MKHIHVHRDNLHIRINWYYGGCRIRSRINKSPFTLTKCAMKNTIHLLCRETQPIKYSASGKTLLEGTIFFLNMWVCVQTIYILSDVVDRLTYTFIKMIWYDCDEIVKRNAYLLHLSQSLERAPLMTALQHWNAFRIACTSWDESP